jgi:hypothetical protein
MVVHGEIIRGVTVSPGRLEVITTDSHDALVVLVPLQQLCTIREKCWVRYAVILQDDASLHVVKEPRDGGTDGLLAS